MAAATTKLVSDGTTHAVALTKGLSHRWLALCGLAFMIEGDPLPTVIGQVSCLGCMAAEGCVALSKAA